MGTKYPAVRVTVETKKYLDQRSKSTGDSIPQYIDKLIKEDKRRQFFAEARDFYAQDAEAVAQQKEETAAIEKALFNE